MSLKILKPRLKPFTYSLFRFQSTEQKENDNEIEYEEEEFRKIDIFPPKKNLVLNVQRTKRTYHSDKVSFNSLSDIIYENFMGKRTNNYVHAYRYNARVKLITLVSQY